MAKIDLRRSNKDPDYERIVGQREARAKLYSGKIWNRLGFLTALVGIAIPPLFILTIIFFVIGIRKKILGNYLTNKYRE
jgi:hypothetical protein